ncbi:MAG: o-succinylbenzoate synthase, partial [Muribaculaceae bacterium]|nr:o-succinylbenzoate synthase [Muribaculaceae bacterium]
MLHAQVIPYRLHFKETAVTSRARMTVKDTYILRLTDPEAHPGIDGIGEIALFRGLSREDTPDFPRALRHVIDNIGSIPLASIPQSSIRFGIETALLDLRGGGRRILFDTPFSASLQMIPVNGLVWMGDYPTMRRRLISKIEAGFTTIKIKIGGIDFEQELSLLRLLRSDFSERDLTLRLDANGAFSPADALSRLDRLAPFRVHSIEQPIRPGQLDEMARIVSRSPIPIALDEELIGVTPDAGKALLLDSIRPHFIILKPSLCGGLAEADSWIRHAVSRGIGWWATSALESNVGLNAIAQWVSRYAIRTCQGLGTGALYTDNFPSALRMRGESLALSPSCIV